MNKDLKIKIVHPQEIEVWYVLPVIRKELALAMKKQGLDQKTIAKLLGITAAAVSQYFNNKRAKDFQIDDKLNQEFTISAKKILDDDSLIFAEVQRLLKLFWDEGIVCKLHQSKSWCPHDCEVCF